MRRRTTLGAVCLLLAGLTACGSDRHPAAPSLPPAHHATTVTIPRLDAARSAFDPGAARAVVRDPRARVGSFSVVPGHPQRAAATWYVCRDPRCYHRTSASVVTDDGFRHVRWVHLPVSRNYFGYGFQPAGPDHFVVTVNAGHPRLVDLRGHVREIAVGGAAGRLAPGEVAVGGKGIRHWLALDPPAGLAHPLSTPPDTVEMQTQPSGQLRALSGAFRYSWSDDGGSTWHRMPLPAADRHLMAGMIPSTSDSVHALQLGGDGATGFPWDRVLESVDGRTWTSYDGPRSPLGFANPVAVLPDGRLVLDVDGWSDQRGSRPSVKLPGLWSGSDWSHLSPVRLSPPFSGQDVHRFVPTVLDVATDPRVATIYVLTPAQDGVVASTDGGATWRPVRAR